MVILSSHFVHLSSLSLIAAEIVAILAAEFKTATPLT